MNAVRRLFDDLVEKKLWPAALLLVLTAIAVPFVIGGGGDGDAAAIPDAAATLASGAAAAPTAVELVGPPAVRSRGGIVRDPFRRTKAKADDTSPAAAAAASSKSAASSETKSDAPKKKSAASGSKKKSAASGSKRKTTTPKAQPVIDPATIALARSSYQTVVRFTRPGGTRERPLARLAVLGNPAGPALQYIGVAGDGTHAIFVVGPNATAAGDSACLVSPCRAVRLARGERVGVDVVGKDFLVRHYELEVIGLRRLHMATPASARAWRARVDPAGAAVLKTLQQDPATASVLDRLRYTLQTGTVSLLSAP